jgi:hypothetical protein
MRVRDLPKRQDHHSSLVVIFVFVEIQVRFKGVETSLGDTRPIEVVEQV